MDPKEALAKLEKGFKNGVRFCVEAPSGRYSGTWLALGNRSDYYLAARAIGGTMKVSFHVSGICRVALLEAGVADLKARGIHTREDRAFVKWRKTPTPSIGAVHVASVRFPVAYLDKDPRIGKPGRTLLVVQAPPDSSVVEMGFFYTREEPDAIEDRFNAIGKPMIYTKLENGEYVWMVARPVEAAVGDIPTDDKLAEITVRHSADAEPDDKIVAIFWNDPGDGGTLLMSELGRLRIRNRKPVLLHPQNDDPKN